VSSSPSAVVFPVILCSYRVLLSYCLSGIVYSFPLAAWVTRWIHEPNITYTNRACRGSVQFKYRYGRLDASDGRK